MSATTRHRWLGVAVLAALALHAWSMEHAHLTLAHMLWSCHVASLVLALGLLAQLRLAVCAGLLFHLAIGLPMWLVEVIVSRGTFGGPEVVGHLLVTSILVHVAPIAAGFVSLGFQEMPRSAVLAAWLIPVGMLPVSRWLTPPEVNVNVAHAVWPPAAGIFHSWWLFQMVLRLACLASLTVVRIIWNFAVLRRGRE